MFGKVSNNWTSLQPLYYIWLLVEELTEAICFKTMKEFNGPVNRNKFLVIASGVVFSFFF
jgi:hypothetical protein